MTQTTDRMAFDADGLLLRRLARNRRIAGVKPMCWDCNAEMPEDGRIFCGGAECLKSVAVSAHNTSLDARQAVRDRIRQRGKARREG